jgi:two-component system, sensor histidine kinase
MPETPAPEIEDLRRELEKERSDRREAQAVLDAVLQATSEDLIRKNRDLVRLNDELDARVRARTADLARAMSQAERADAAKSDFLARMSHEIRTPMNGVLGMLEVLRAGHLEPDQARCLRTAHESALSLLRLIDDLLDMSKIEAGMLELEMLEFDLHALLHETLQLWTQQAQRRNLTLELEVPADTPRFVMGDAARLRQVLTNLLSNALKFTERGFVRISAVPAGAAGVGEQGQSEMPVHFSVQDSGIGIAPEAQRSLFAPFAQADRSISRRFGGTGLGLAICKQLITMMGGEIGVDSAPGTGTRFSFTLPLLLSATHAKADPPRILSDPRVSHQYAASVLVADDTDTNREVAAALLSVWGCTTRFAADGHAALDSVSAHPPDLVLMDCQMPGMDGIAAAREIRRRERESGAAVRLPIIAVSAAGSREAHERCSEAGMDDFIMKPLGIQAIGRMLERWLPGSAKRSTAAAVEVAAPALGPETSSSCGRAASSFDHAQMQEMRLAAGEGFASLVVRFEAAARTQVGELQAALRRGDVEAVRRLAHKLKGASSSLGAKGLAGLCDQLLRLAQSGSLARSAALAERLDSELAGAIAVLSDIPGAAPAEIA